MKIKDLEKYIKSKLGVTVRRSGTETSYFLNDRLFVLLRAEKDKGAIVSLKAKRAELEYYKSEYADCVFESEQLEPLHWNDFLVDRIADDVILNAVDESYGIIYADLSPHAKKALDPNEPNYKYVMKNFDLQKVMRERLKDEE